MRLRDPHLTQFVELVLQGAAAHDIHPVGSPLARPCSEHRPSDAFVQRELQRVEMHLRGLVPILQGNCHLVDRVLDVGCSTGGTTCAIALSERYSAADIVGVDVDELSIAAAKVRAQGLGLANRVRFEAIASGDPLPFADGAFDLVVSVSVLEFVPGELRTLFLSELERVTRVGGYIYLATPHALRLREVHSQRWLGNLRRSIGQPWASTRWEIRRSLKRSSAIPLIAPAAIRAARRIGLRTVPWSMQATASLALSVGTWKKMLFRRQSP